ncbi:MAG: hypothetical protein AMXMBFR66_27320 [Pseudomonadota bacterium]|nr:type VI secretion system-associated protein TagF [Rubrivivax sp.]
MDAAGWHGKLPSLGDFASRRLEPAFIEVWDGWLAQGMLALREADAAGWLAAYLASPSWRFWLLPAVLPGPAGRQGWAGVLMPSVDRVGRYYPLTLALPLVDTPASGVQLQALWHWLGRLDELARDALFDDWSAERLEAELARAARPEAARVDAAAALPDLAAALPDAAALVELPPGLDAAEVIDVQAQRAWAGRARARAWWQAVPDAAPRRLLVSHGLPAANDFARLFGRAGGAAPTMASHPGSGAAP